MKIVEVRHPLVQHKIGLMRNAALSTKDFRELANELGTLLAYEATADLDTEPHTLPGWAGPVTVQRIAGAKITVVPILRAGLGMLSGVLSLIPAARVSVVGLQRDEETLQPVPYFERLTGRLEERDALILDPMLATGGTLIATIDMLKRAGARRIKGIFLVAAPEGIEAVKAVHPDVEIYTAAIDAQLNRKGSDPIPHSGLQPGCEGFQLADDGVPAIEEAQLLMLVTQGLVRVHHPRRVAAALPLVLQGDDGGEAQPG